jgi:hypothetical protein
MITSIPIVNILDKEIKNIYSYVFTPNITNYSKGRELG